MEQGAPLPQRRDAPPPAQHHAFDQQRTGLAASARRTAASRRSPPRSAAAKHHDDIVDHGRTDLRPRRPHPGKIEGVEATFDTTQQRRRAQREADPQCRAALRPNTPRPCSTGAAGQPPASRSSAAASACNVSFAHDHRARRAGPCAGSPRASASCSCGHAALSAPVEWISAARSFQSSSRRARLPYKPRGAPTFLRLSYGAERYTPVTPLATRHGQDDAGR